MNFRHLSALGLVWLFFLAVTHAVKVDGPGEAESNSTNILTGTITVIYSRQTRDASYEWTHCVAAIRVESIEKGDGLKTGDLVYARYIGAVKWLGKRTLPPGSGGHNNVPAEGERRKICLTKNSDGGFDVYYVSGFKMSEGKKR